MLPSLEQSCRVNERESGRLEQNMVILWTEWKPHLRATVKEISDSWFLISKVRKQTNGKTGLGSLLDKSSLYEIRWCFASATMLSCSQSHAMIQTS